jgi:hypothetical protein
MKERDAPRLLPFAEAADQIGVPPEWLRREIREGRVPALKAGSWIVVDPEWVEQLLVQRARKGEQEADRGV